MQPIYRRFHESTQDVDNFKSNVQANVTKYNQDIDFLQMEAAAYKHTYEELEKSTVDAVSLRI